MDRKVNCESEHERDKEAKARAADIRRKFDESIRRQWAENCRIKALKELGPRHQHFIEKYISLQLDDVQRDEHINILVNEIREGRVSFAYEALDRFPRSLVEVLRHDITHLDLTANNIRCFEFIRGFKGLKSLIIDLNGRMDVTTLPPVDTLELFYANKCKIEFPRSFVFRVSVVFPSLKYLSMMYNPALKRFYKWEIQARDHRNRMYAIFMLPNMIHYNDRRVTDDEREHSKAYHVYLGPIDCKLWKFTTLPDTDDIRAILPVHIRSKTAHLRAMDWQDDEDALDDALKSVSISDYFTSRQVDSISINSFTSSDNNTATSDGSPTSSIITDDGVGSLAPSEQSENFL